MLWRGEKKREGGSGGKAEGREKGGGRERREEGDRIQRSGREKGNRFSDILLDPFVYFLYFYQNHNVKVSMYRNVIR